MILVTGAAGKTGQAICQRLVQAEENVRAFVYRPEHQAIVTQLGVAETIVGDMAQADIYRQATNGIEAMYHICSNMNPAEVEIGRIAIAAAQAAKVKRFVYHSVLHPQTEKMPHHWHKLRVEEMLFESGLDVTILQPAAYMQNVLAGWKKIIEQGVYQIPYPVETKLSMVDLTDVATVAANVLTEAGHQGAIYELVGPGFLSQTEVAGFIGQRLGRLVKAEEVSIEAWTAAAKAGGLGDYAINTLVKMFHYYARYGFRGSPNTLAWLLGRTPISFQEFLEGLATESL